MLPLPAQATPAAGWRSGDDGATVANGDHKFLKMLMAWGSAIAAVVIAAITIDGHYISEAEAQQTTAELKSEIADAKEEQAKSSKTQAVYNEINMLETQVKLANLELSYLADKTAQTARDGQRIAYLQASIATMENRALVLKGDLSGSP